MIALGVTVSSARADLMIDFVGAPGSGTVTWEAHGSVTTAGFTNALGSDLSFRIPKENGDWELLDLSGSGDTLTQQSISNNNGNGILSYVIGGGSQIDFDLGRRNVVHDLNAILPVLQSVSYPTLNGGTQLSFSGKGAFILNGGATFENVLNVGSYAHEINGGKFVMNVSIPEPGGAVLGGVSIVAILMSRHRRAPAPNPALEPPCYDDEKGE